MRSRKSRIRKQFKAPQTRQSTGPHSPHTFSTRKLGAHLHIDWIAPPPENFVSVTEHEVSESNTASVCRETAMNAAQNRDQLLAPSAQTFQMQSTGSPCISCAFNSQGWTSFCPTTIGLRVTFENKVFGSRE